MRNGRKITKKIQANCRGSAPGMETEGAIRIFDRSVQKHDACYHYGDGDSKSYEKVQNIYNGKHVIKYECIGHYQKRVRSVFENCEQKQKVSVERIS